MGNHGLPVDTARSGGIYQKEWLSPTAAAAQLLCPPRCSCCARRTTVLTDAVSTESYGHRVHRHTPAGGTGHCGHGAGVARAASIFFWLGVARAWRGHVLFPQERPRGVVDVEGQRRHGDHPLGEAEPQLAGARRGGERLVPRQLREVGVQGTRKCRFCLWTPQPKSNAEH
eukprot:gene6718-biopygen4438